MANHERKKIIIGLVLACLYLFFGGGHFLGLTLALMVNQEITLGFWWSVLWAGIFLIAFACVLIKIKFKKVWIWFFFLDFFFFPLAIPFYYYVQKNFHEPLTIISIKRRTIKKWACIQFIILTALNSYSIIFWFVLFLVGVEIVNRGLGPAVGVLITTIFILGIFIASFIGSLLIMSYSLKKIPVPKLVIILSMLTPTGVTWPLGLLLLNKRIKIEEEPPIYYPNNFSMTS